MSAPFFAPGLHNLKTQYQPCLAGSGVVEWDRGGAEQDWPTVGHRAPIVRRPTFVTNPLVTMQALQSCPLFLEHNWKGNDTWTWPMSSTSSAPPRYQPMRPGPWRWVGCPLTMLTPVSFPFPVAEDGPGLWGPGRTGTGHSVPMAILSQQWLFACKKVGVF